MWRDEENKKKSADKECPKFKLQLLMLMISRSLEDLGLILALVLTRAASFLIRVGSIPQEHSFSPPHLSQVGPRWSPSLQRGVNSRREGAKMG